MKILLNSWCNNITKEYSNKNLTFKDCQILVCTLLIKEFISNMEEEELEDHISNMCKINKEILDKNSCIDEELFREIIKSKR